MTRLFCYRPRQASAFNYSRLKLYWNWAIR